MLSGKKPAVKHKVVSILGVESLYTARKDGVAVLVSLCCTDMEEAAVEIKVAEL